jgi:hypothetical protein
MPSEDTAFVVFVLLEMWTLLAYAKGVEVEHQQEDVSWISEGEVKFIVVAVGWLWLIGLCIYLKRVLIDGIKYGKGA